MKDYSDVQAFSDHHAHMFFQGVLLDAPEELLRERLVDDPGTGNGTGTGTGTGNDNDTGNGNGNNTAEAFGRLTPDR